MGSFDSVWLKIERGREHMVELGGAIRQYFESGACELVKEDGPDAGQVSWVLRVHEPLPARMSLLLGDAVHNIRAALDQFAYSAVKNPTSQTAFPIWRAPRTPTAQDLSALTKGKLRGANRDVIAAVAAMQPCEGGADELIWAVDYLDVVDKHRLLATVMTTNETVNLNLADLLGAEGRAAHDPGFVNALAGSFVGLRPAQRHPTDGEAVFTVPADREADYSRTSASFDVALVEPAPLAAEPVVTTLNACADGVEKLLRRLVDLA